MDCLPILKPRKIKKPKIHEPEPEPVKVFVAGLPGENPYDDAVVNRGFTYANAKQREEVRLLDEKIKQAKISTESAQIALERERLTLQEQKGVLISKESYLVKQEAIVSTFKELVRLITSECGVFLPAEVREETIETLERKTDAAFTAIAASVLKNKPRDFVIQSLNDAFNNTP